MTLVKTIEVFKQHAAVNYNFTFALILPYIISSEQNHIEAAIGSAQYEKFTEEAFVPAAPAEIKVFELLERASANLALLAYTKVAIISISDAGFHISSNQNSTPAEWWQIRDLRRQLLTTGTQAIDKALEIMEANPTVFTEWTNSDTYTEFKEFFVRQTKTFQRHFNIKNSRLTFLQLRPHLLKVENKYFNGLLGEETVSQIKEGSTPLEDKALELCQAAQVMLCVSEVAHEGAFLLTPTGLFVISEEIQGEKKQGLSENERYNLHRAKQEDGNAYLKTLVELLNKHPEEFTAFAKRAKNQQTNPAHDTKSIVSF